MVNIASMRFARLYRGTFYNHIFRRKEVTAYDKRRAEMKEHIKTVFDESQAAIWRE